MCGYVDEYVSDSLASYSGEERNMESAETRVLKKQRFSTSTNSGFSSSRQRFRNAQENTEF